MGRHLLALTLALAVVAGACGDSGDSSEVASLEETPIDAVPAADAQIEVEEALIDFAECVRQEGVDFPDPVFDADGNLRLDAGGFEGEFDVDELLAARDACSEFLEGVTLTDLGFDRTAIEDDLYEYAACMRDQGYDLPDPDFAGFLRRTLGPGSQNPEGAEGFGIFPDLDPTDPEFLAADEVCRPQVFADFEGGVPPPPPPPDE